jgi:hypothetical protein
MGGASLDGEEQRAAAAGASSGGAGEQRGRAFGAVGLPRTHFGRRLSRGLAGRLRELVVGGLVEERDGRYRVSERGRRVLAEWAFDGVVMERWSRSPFLRIRPMRGGARSAATLSEGDVWQGVLGVRRTH